MTDDEIKPITLQAYDVDFRTVMSGGFKVTFSLPGDMSNSLQTARLMALKMAQCNMEIVITPKVEAE